MSYPTPLIERVFVLIATGFLALGMVACGDDGTGANSNSGENNDNGNSDNHNSENGDSGDISFAFERVSVGEDGQESQSDSSNPSVSADGRFVAFESRASEFVDSVDNELLDIYVYDRETEEMTLASVDKDGNHAEDGADGSMNASISADGRFVAFESLVLEDVEFPSRQIYVRDLQEEQTHLISRDSEGEVAGETSRFPSISDDGRYVAFRSDWNMIDGEAHEEQAGLQHNGQIYRHDRESGETIRVSRNAAGEMASATDGELILTGDPAISGNGQYITFSTNAENLVETDVGPGANIYLRDVTSHEITVISASTAEHEISGSGTHSSISADGRYVTFDAGGIYIRDRQEDTLEPIEGPPGTTPHNLATISDDGNYLAYLGSSSAHWHDREAGEGHRVLTDDGVPGNVSDVSISGDGSSVVFASDSTELVDGIANDSSDIFVVEVEK